MMMMRLRIVLFLPLAIAWALPVAAMPDDPDARAPRSAAADLACAASEGGVPGCPPKAHSIAVAGSSGEYLRGYLRRAAAGADAARPRAPAIANDVDPIIHALREVTAAMGPDAGADVLIAFGSRPVREKPDRNPGKEPGTQAAGFPFGSLYDWSAPLSDIYRSAGARFDRALFNVVDPQRLIAWNTVTPQSVPEVPMARGDRPGLLGPALSYSRADASPENAPGDPAPRPVKQKRAIVYMERGRTTVMVVEDKEPK